jgi:hypothetical protein
MDYVDTATSIRYIRRLQVFSHYRFGGLMRNRFGRDVRRVTAVHLAAVANSGGNRIEPLRSGKDNGGVQIATEETVARETLLAPLHVIARREVPCRFKDTFVTDPAPDTNQI